MCILPSSTHCTSSHGLPNNLTQRLAKHFVSSGLPSSPAQARHSDLEHSCARASPHSRICCTVFHSHSLNSSRDSKHQCQLLLQNRDDHDSDVTRFRNTHTAPHKIGTTISRAQPGYPLLCRCTKICGSTVLMTSHHQTLVNLIKAYEV